MTILEKKRICPICEAGCGLTIKVQGREVIAIEANDNDVFSTGHLCPKGISLKELDADPDRLRKPLVRESGTDSFKEVSWNEAFELIRSKFCSIRETDGANAIASYIGNPSAHNIGLSMGLGVFVSSLGSKNIYSAGSVDQLPKQLASELMFGNDVAVPVPDIERCDYLLMLGANPVVSNGSLWMVPKFREKLRALHARGGRLVTVDPRYTETARAGDEHHYIRPGTDAWLLAAIINELTKRGCELPSQYHSKNLAKLKDKLEAITIVEAAQHTGLTESAIVSIAAQLEQSAHAAVYGRVGTTLQAFGTLTSFLIEIINLLTGSLDSTGGAMFGEQAYTSPTAPAGEPRYDRYQSRVSGYPEIMGQLPVVALAEEIETPGEGQVKALVCFAGNPIVSNPDSDRLEKALGSLEFIVCVDIYHTETSKYADVILPGSSPFEDGHYDGFLGSWGYRNAARYSPPIFDSDSPDEWDLGLTLAYVLSHDSPPSESELRSFEDDVVAAAITGHVNDESGHLFGRDVQELLAKITPERGVERLLDLGIRAGNWGDHFGAKQGLTLQKLIDTPDGIDKGALRENRLSEIVATADGLLDLGPKVIIADIDRLISQVIEPGFLLIGRRNVGSNNSWLRNLPMLAKGRNLCVLEMNTVDASELDIINGDKVRVESNGGSVVVPVKVTDSLAPKVVSLPHGFSEDKSIKQRHARSGANYNRLVGSALSDRLSGTASLNGVPVSIVAV
jgi:anaerobic selenocysteine-containing dehydrogenase